LFYAYKTNFIMYNTILSFLLMVSAFSVSAQTVGTGRPVLLGPEVNTIYGDADPKISPDGQWLFICRRNDPDNIGGPDTGADIWWSVRQADGSWSKAVNMGPSMNNIRFNMVIGIREDGNALMLQGLYEGNRFSFDGVSVCYRTDQGEWSKPIGMKIRDYKHKEGSVSYSLSPDFQTMLLGIREKDSFGEEDIYVSFRQPDDTWSKPKNLGATINTAKGEISPVLAHDGKTLYFSSRGHVGYGNYDIFMTKRLDDTWTNWSPPVNMGELINTPGYDADLTLDAKGEVAYFSRKVHHATGFDIYQVTLPEALKPDPVVLVKGRVQALQNGAPLKAAVSFYNKHTGEFVAKTESQSGNGNFQIILKYGCNYSLQAALQEETSAPVLLDLSQLKGYQEIEQTLILKAPPSPNN
jgi:hypothetical protein